MSSKIESAKNTILSIGSSCIDFVRIAASTIMSKVGSAAKFSIKVIANALMFSNVISAAALLAPIVVAKNALNYIVDTIESLPSFFARLFGLDYSAPSVASAIASNIDSAVRFAIKVTAEASDIAVSFPATVSMITIPTVAMILIGTVKAIESIPSFLANILGYGSNASTDKLERGSLNDAKVGVDQDELFYGIYYAFWVLNFIPFSDSLWPGLDAILAEFKNKAEVASAESTLDFSLEPEGAINSAELVNQQKSNSREEAVGVGANPATHESDMSGGSCRQASCKAEANESSDRAGEAAAPRRLSHQSSQDSHKSGPSHSLDANGARRLSQDSQGLAGAGAGDFPSRPLSGNTRIGREFSLSSQGSHANHDATNDDTSSSGARLKKP